MTHITKCPATFSYPSLARTNYWAELAEILHGILLGDSTWDNQGVFGNSIGGLEMGYPWGYPEEVKNSENFFLDFLIFSKGNESLNF